MCVRVWGNDPHAGGWQVAEYASKTLITNVQKELGYAFEAPDRDPNAPASPAKVAAAIQRAFGRTDRELMAQVAPAFKLGFGAVARCGSCALLTLVHEDFLHVANGTPLDFIHPSKTTCAYRGSMHIGRGL